MTDKEVVEYIHRYFIYNTDGTFSRTDRKNSKGSLDKDGYLIIKIKGKQYKAHRLVYAYHFNKFPDKEIDHLNRCRTDNRIENLRDVGRLENNRNIVKKPNSNTGVVGIYIDNTKGLKKKYAFYFKGKTYRFYTLKEACEARKDLMGRNYGDV
jgi:hypothetical protein